MNSKVLLKHAILAAITSLLLLESTDFAQSDPQPQSTITPSDDQYVLLNDAAESITLTTTDVPKPKCTGDTPDGDPDWFWDTGPLDIVNKDDGTLKVNTDIEGTYNVTVYCKQHYDNSQGGGGYDVQTQTSK
jgi:hypothetical protein